MELTGEIAAVRDGRGDPARLVGEFRRAALLVPLTATADGTAESDGSHGGLMSAVQGGIRWVYAFTDEEALARFAGARGAAGREWPYLSILGARLVDAVVPMVDGPAGVVVNVADEDGSMFFPPVAGIVPDACAVDAVDVA
ncbi:SseB family protein [Streptomyces sp. KS 21]|uniref:SseB family protein n=1 Tax=Streptomyces sp. KS 21 TaxID=2485150 RepID=UPI00106413F0|nr:SseB family protein [Streptomyces sp. KS 21]TDU74210.1 type III secretion system (T3SS) SseB-like protein [Streptomyces sp. KS 21]